MRLSFNLGLFYSSKNICFKTFHDFVCLVYLILLLLLFHKSWYFGPPLFWDVTQRTLVLIYRSFGAHCRYRLQGWPWYYLALEQETEWLFRNASKQQPTYAGWHLRGAEALFYKLVETYRRFIFQMDSDISDGFVKNIRLYCLLTAVWR